MTEQSSWKRGQKQGYVQMSGINLAAVRVKIVMICG